MATYQQLYRQVDFRVDFDNHHPLLSERSDAVDRRVIALLGLVLAIVLLFVMVLPRIASSADDDPIAALPPDVQARLKQTLAASGGTVLQAPRSSAAHESREELATVFTEEVLFWTPHLVRWAEAHHLDPNVVATIMQVESCGDPLAISSAGAQGLFQVMPFHFEENENMLDPETNALRGLNYLVERLQQTDGDLGRAFAGYNGGHVAAGSSWDSWVDETQRYYVWTTGIMGDIEAGRSPSPTLEKWLAAGGSSLCSQAARRLGLADRSQ